MGKGDRKRGCEGIEKLTVNSPVFASNPTCTLCTKPSGEDIVGDLLAASAVKTNQ